MNKTLNKLLCRHFNRPTSDSGEGKYEPIFDKETGEHKKDINGNNLYLKGFVTGWDILIETITDIFLLALIYFTVTSIGVVSSFIDPIPNGNNGILFNETIRGTKVIAIITLAIVTITWLITNIDKILIKKIAICPLVKQKTTAMELYEEQLKENLK